MPSYTYYRTGWQKLVVINNTVSTNTFEASTLIRITMWYESEAAHRRYLASNARKIIELKRMIAMQIVRWE